VLALTGCLILVCASGAIAATYYVDSLEGDDAYNGLSPTSPWRSLDRVNAMTFAPGDVLLFRVYCSWRGQLWPKGSGVDGDPIIIDVYHGPDDVAPEPYEPTFEWGKAAIHGEGETQEAFRVYNQEYWEIHNLEVTNYDPEGPEVNPIRQGVRILGEDAGTLDHIYVRWLWVHHVNGSLTEGEDHGDCNAGILFDVEGVSVPTNFNDVLIERCTVQDIDKTGIKTWTNWNRSDCGERAPYTNLAVRDNWVHGIAGSGIVVCTADAPLLEGNVPMAINERTGGPNAGIRLWDTDDALIQRNEVYWGCWGAHAFEIGEMTRGTILQYNYSHLNEGGLLVMREYGDPSACFFNDDAVVRYNISQNGRDAVFRIEGKVTNASIYNNTIYIGPEAEDPDVCRHTASGSIVPQGIHYHNNIFYNLGTGGYDLGATGSTFDYNLFYGNHPASEPADAHKLTGDPRLLSPGTGAQGRATVDGYMPRSDSPCVDSGTAMPASGGEDFWGKVVPYGSRPDRGAFEYSGQAGTLVTLTVVSDAPGVPIQVSPADTNGDADGLADFTRVYEWGTVVTLTVPTFYVEWGWFSWGIDGAGQWASAPTWTITMGADHTVLAWYEHQAFIDVPLDYWAYREIEVCSEAGIVSGYDDGCYHPDWSVSRDQMAVFISRGMAGGDGNVPPGPTTATFDDIPTDHWAYDYVEYCVARDVIQGYDPVTYGPADLVARDAMATFIARAIAGGDANVPAGPAAATFDDVPTDYWAYKYVEYCFACGVVQGYDAVTYSPASSVSRDQMAVFICRAFALPI
jgi:hypothetical protein